MEGYQNFMKQNVNNQRPTSFILVYENVYKPKVPDPRRMQIFYSITIFSDRAIATDSYLPVQQSTNPNIDRLLKLLFLKINNHPDTIHTPLAMITPVTTGTSVK